jgi:hypothetical protein
MQHEIDEHLLHASHIEINSPANRNTMCAWGLAALDHIGCDPMAAAGKTTRNQSAARRELLLLKNDGEPSEKLRRHREKPMLTISVVPKLRKRYFPAPL